MKSKKRLSTAYRESAIYNQKYASVLGFEKAVMARDYHRRMNRGLNKTVHALKPMETHMFAFNNNANRKSYDIPSFDRQSTNVTPKQRFEMKYPFFTDESFDHMHNQTDRLNLK